MRYVTFLRSEFQKLGRRYVNFCRTEEALQKVAFGEVVQIVDDPVIRMHPEASIVVGARVTLNSDNSGYHVSMHSPVKLLADVPGARISIGDDTRIHGACIHAWKSITIGKRCLIAANSQIIDSNGHPTALNRPEVRIIQTDSPKSIVIGDDVWIGTGAIILPGVTIGNGSIIGAGAVVAKDIPEGVVVVGNPARVISPRECSSRSEL